MPVGNGERGAQPPWTVLVPVKPLRLAKSRLGGDPAARAGLALGMAQDVVAVALAAPGVGAVLVVTDDSEAGRLIAEVRHEGDPPLTVVPGEPGAGLSSAVAHGAAIAIRRDPRGRLAVLMSDLPALRTQDLAMALDAAGGAPRTVAADSAGRGTVLLTGGPGTDLSPAYEGRSFAAHISGGATDITASVHARLRRDVDTAADLAAAVSLGVGPATTAALVTWRSGGRERMRA